MSGLFQELAYRPTGKGVLSLRRLAETLKPGGVFALWSNDPPEADFLSIMQEVFSGVEAREVWFGAVQAEAVAANTVYLGTGSRWVQD